MSLFLIAQKLWRYKLVTLPVILLVLVGAFYVIAVTAPIYQASSTYILVSPPAPPTPDEIARDPRLGVGTDNPYTRYSDQSIVVQLLASRLSGDDARLALAKHGADPRYTVATSPTFGLNAPIVEITGTGATPPVAIKTAQLVGQALVSELDRMQKAHGVAAKYRIETQLVVAAQEARMKASGKLRSLVAVFALGAVLLFVVISVADAVTAVRAKWAGQVRVVDTADLGLVEPLVPLEPDAASSSDPDPDATGWLRAQQR